MLKKAAQLKYKRRTFFYAAHCMPQQSNQLNDLAGKFVPQPFATVQARFLHQIMRKSQQ